jgi:hypothetical protein
MGHSTSK